MSTQNCKKEKLMLM